MKTLKVLLQEVVSGIKAWVNSNFAQESNTVHKTGNETVNGDKYLTGYIRHTLTYDCIQATAFDVRTDPEANRGRDIFRFWEGDRSSLGDYLGGMSYFQETDGSSRLQLICFGYPTTGNPSQQRINFHAYRDGTGSFYPVRNNVNLGTSSNQWNNVYAKNYFYNGTAWGLDKANVWSVGQTIRSSYPDLYLQNPGLAMGSNANIGGCAVHCQDTAGNDLAYVSMRVNSAARTVVELCTRNTYKNSVLSNDQDAEVISSSFIFGQLWNGAAYYQLSGGTLNDIYPMNLNGTNQNLGTSTNKWKTFNGINPGAMSFPNVGAETDFSGDVVPPTGESGINISGGANTYTPEFDGWISIRYNHATVISVVRSVACSFGNVLSLPSAGEITLSMPVIANVTYQIRIIATETNKYTHFYFTKSKGDPTNP